MKYVDLLTACTAATPQALRAALSEHLLTACTAATLGKGVVAFVGFLLTACTAATSSNTKIARFISRAC